MSYARFSWCDVYVFVSVEGHLDCCGCSLPPGWFEADTTAEMLDHLQKHREAGHDVPDEVFDALRADAAVNDADMAKTRSEGKETP